MNIVGQLNVNLLKYGKRTTAVEHNAADSSQKLEALQKQFN